MRKTVMFSAILLGIFLTGTIAVKAQKSEAALASIDYEFVHVNDTNNRDKPVKLNMRVYLGLEGSHYINHTMAEARERMEARIREMNLSSSGTVSGVRINMGASYSQSGAEEFFLFPTQKKLIMVDQIAATEYLVGHDFPDLDWEIGEETKEIDGFFVQAARTSFGGRDYTAWFAPELPFSFGPWKLHGLPGLILEARDETAEVQFNFKSFDRLEADQAMIALPEKGVEASPTQFARAKAAFQENPMAGIQSSVPATGTTIRETRLVVREASSGNQRVLSGTEAEAEMERLRLQRINSNNNPVERETKKKN